jgi:diguanylate cyclase (GGDEF)-like protein
MRALGRRGLTQQVALLSLVPMVMLGLALAQVLQGQIVSRALDGAGESARLIARLAIQPRLSRADLVHGLTAQGVRALDEQLQTGSVTGSLERIKVWNADHRIVYSDDSALVGRSFPTGGDADLRDALAGRPGDAEVVTPSPRTETASEVGLGRLVEVYVPIRFAAAERPAGAFEMYLSYRPIAAAIAGDDRTIVLVVSIGLALLWASLIRIVGGASRRLRRQSQQNYALARNDSLTGLPNRAMFMRQLGLAVAARLRDGDGAAPGPGALLIDLEGFKEINDTLGHSTGDHVLQEVGRRLRAQLGEDAVVARLGGDEYAVLSPSVTSSAEALTCAGAIQGALQAPIAVNDVALNIEASVGAAVLGEHADDPDLLVQRADMALAHAKARHSNAEVYSRDLDRSTPARLKLLGEVRPALERDEFLLHYQPKIDLVDRRLVGVEALLRWSHGERGVVPPMEFIPLVEQTALVGPLTMHVIDLALRQLACWREEGVELKMAVNLSARNLVDRDLPDKVARLLERHQVPADQLIVEVTESAALADAAAAVQGLRALRDTGIGVSIDDFGTGNASFSYLAKLPASELKIDRSFISDVCTDTRNEAIVRSTIDLARNLDLAIVAEGIETDAVLGHLTELGCDMGQGFGIAPPLPADELTARLAELVGPDVMDGARELDGSSPARGSSAAGSGGTSGELRGDVATAAVAPAGVGSRSAPLN